MSEQGEPHKHHLTWAIPIVLYLLTQTSLAIWWASGVTTQLNTITRDFSSYAIKQDNEELRQWGAINGTEKDINDLARSVDLNNQRVETLSDRVRENNELLREIFIGNGSGGR